MSDWAAPRPLILGHRGASASAVENSLAAFALAAEMGADGVELDVRLSADGRPVILHDATVDRTTAGSGAVHSYTASALAELGVPALDDLFQAHGPSLLYNIELKDFSAIGSDLAAAVAERVEAYGLGGRVLISSFNPLALRRARRHFTAATPLGWLHDRAALRFLASFVGASFLHPHYRLVDAAYMRRASAMGCGVIVWTVDQVETAQRMIDLGVHAIITNRPGFLREHLQLSE